MVTGKHAQSAAHRYSRELTYRILAAFATQKAFTSLLFCPMLRCYDLYLEGFRGIYMHVSLREGDHDAGFVKEFVDLVPYLAYSDAVIPVRNQLHPEIAGEQECTVAELHE